MRYILQKYNGLKTRFDCPKCNGKKTFTRYIDTETNKHIHPTVGRCNRESNCGYHYTPKQYFRDNNISFDTSQFKAYKPQPFTSQPKPVSFIPVEIFKDSLKGYANNHFINYLINLFGEDITKELIERYFIATSKIWNGATVFWQIDKQGNIRTGKIMLYSPSNGKRVKEPHIYINWVHKVLKWSDFELKQCLFGEHLLVDESKPVAIVESEKTAIIASVYIPNFIWVAVGSLSNLNNEKCSILKSRKVVLFPDLKGYDRWSNKAKELSKITTFKVSDLLELNASESEKEKGLDLADFLIKFDFKDFILPNTIDTDVPLAVNLISQEQKHLQSSSIFQFDKKEQKELENWNNTIIELEELFLDIKHPNYPICIKQAETITDISLFIKSHIPTVKANNGKLTFMPYLKRLQELISILA
jgi:rubredoxin